MAVVLRGTSLLSPVFDAFFEGVFDHVARGLGRDPEFYGEEDFRDRRARLQEMDLAAICGADYLRWRAAPQAEGTPVAGLVMNCDRYQGQPIYYADVLVRADSSVRRFEDLAGCVFALNEPCSFSGSKAMECHLRSEGRPAGFFAHRLRTGSHLESIRAVAEGKADAATIDSTILDRIAGPGVGRGPPLPPEGTRILLSLGPFPVPPLVVGPHVEPTTTSLIREILAQFHAQEGNRPLLEHHRVRGFAPVEAADYDPLDRPGSIRDFTDRSCDGTGPTSDT